MKKKHKLKLNFDQFIEINGKELEVVARNTQKSMNNIFSDSVTYGLIYKLTAITQDEPFTVNECESNYNNIYVFEDNTVRQDIENKKTIRDCANSFGVITKRFPSNLKDSFLTNDDINLVKTDLNKLLKLYQSGKTIIFPSKGLGTGIAQLAEHTPELLKYINHFISHNFLMHTDYTKQ